MTDPEAVKPERLALLQFDVDTPDLRGVWFSPTEFYYPAETDPYFITLGHQAMARQFPDLDWQEWVAYLVNSRPVRAWWEQIEYGVRDTPQSVFERFPL